ncbi:MAG: primosomal protein N' [bacterium]
MSHLINVIPLASLPYSKPQSYTYKIEGDFKIGQLVEINFANRNIFGVIVEEKNEWPNEPATPHPPLSGGRVQSQCLSGGQSNPPSPLVRGATKIKTINKIIDNIQLSNEQLKLATLVSDYYHTSLGLVLKLMVPPVLKRPQTKNQKIKKSRNQEIKITLTNEQVKIIDDVKNSKNKTHLIYGITGSGKTEIYLRLIEDAIKQDKQSIVLVPEISLTPQAIERYSERFGQDNIVVFHSNISKSEKFLAWQKIRNNEIKIIIGTRSAIFVPVKNLAYIIVDEEHDSSYKQYDQNPRYNAKKVANFLAEICQAKVVLGSATPSVDSYFETKETLENARDNGLACLKRAGVLCGETPAGRAGVLHKLTKRISGDVMPKVDIVDMRDEFKKGNFTIFSDLLEDKIKENLQNKKQIILYLNRRGAATFVFCRDCGFVEKCPYCDLPLTYHINKTSLICHHCGFSKTISLECPDCKSAAFKYFGCGTQKIEFELTKRFGAVKILRMDRDTTQNRETHQKFYEQFKNKEFDILVGTQMITKGWDLPNVGLVGVVSADTTLNLPDFRSSERTFQLITQVAGRTGRGVEAGEVVLQTYSPDNFAIKAAANHDFDSFYKEEIANRKNLNYPPFTRLVKLFFRNQDKNKTQQTADSLLEKLKNKAKEIDRDLTIEFIGPFPAFISKVRDNFIYQIIIKIKDLKINVNDLLDEIPSNWIVDIDPESLL